MKTTNIEEVESFLNSYGFKLERKSYAKSSEKLTFFDKNGYKYYQFFSHFKNGHVPKIVHYTNPFSIENITLWLKENKINFKILSKKYINHKGKLLFSCGKCLEIFEIDWIHLNIRKSNCPYCTGEKVGKYNNLKHLRPDLVREWSKENKISPENVTCGSTVKVLWVCLKDNKHKWVASILNRAGKNSGCPYCSGRKSDINNNLKNIFPELIEEWDFDKNEKSPQEYTPYSNSYVDWICKKCGHEWSASINSRTNGKNGCPKCSESKGEKRISSFIVKNNIYSESQKTFPLCKNILPLPFDFYLPDYNICIEYDGILHYEDKFNNPKEFEKSKKRDKIKTKYCKKNNIRLVRIPYWEFDNIEKILEQILFD